MLLTSVVEKNCEDDGRINRYDYLYSRGQLETWVPKVRMLSEKAQVSRIYFNNHGRAVDKDVAAVQGCQCILSFCYQLFRSRRKPAPVPELNSTFYSMPSAATVSSWIEKTADLRQFEFSVKLPRRISHDLLPSGKIDLAVAERGQFADVCTTPLRKAGRLGAVLLQLPPEFRYSDRSLSHLAELLEEIRKEGNDIAVEFRDRSWLKPGTEQLVTEAADALTSLNCSSVFVDSPAFPVMRSLTGDHTPITLMSQAWNWLNCDTGQSQRLQCIV